MKLPSFLRRKALTGTPEVLEALAQRQLNPYPLLGGGSRQRIEHRFAQAQSAGYAWMYQRSPAVRTVIDLLASNIGQLDLRLYEEVSEAEREARPRHPAAMSVRYPNLNTTSDLWVRQMVTDYLIFKNAYSVKFRNPANGRITFEWIPASNMEVLGGALFRPEGYRYRRDDGVPVEIPNPDDVFHWRDANPVDPRIGFSPLETLRGAIAEDAALEQAIVELANSGLVSPSWVFRPLEAPDWSNEARQRFEEDLTNRLRRATKSPVVLEEGMELRDVGVSPRETQMLEVRKWTLQKVASLYGVPLGMVGLDDNLEEARKQFISDTLPPICEAFTRALNLSLLVNEYDLSEYTFEFNLDEKHMGEDRLKALVSASGRSVLTTDEARAMINRPPLPGGNELVTPLNVAVGGKPSVDVMPPQDPNKPSQEGDHREEPKGIGWANHLRDDYPDLGRFKAIQPVLELPVGVDQIPQLVPRYRSDLARQHRYTDEVAGELERLYARQAKALLKKGKAADYDSDRWAREMGEDLQKLIRSIVEREAGVYTARLGGDDFDMRNVENYVAAMAYGTAEAITEVTANDAEEMGLRDALARARGERLLVGAASIGTRATGFAREEAAKQAPGSEFRLKVWIPNTERHANLGGAAVPLDSDWGGISPGSEPHCMCSVAIQ